MANYGRIKSTKIAPIGTIMPWGGGSAIGENNDNIPTGWIICNAATQSLNAADYPLLAKVIGNTYGPFPEPTDTTSVMGVNFGIVNGFPYNPNSDSDRHDASKHVDLFALPNLNQVALVDIEPSRIATDVLLELGTYLSKNGTEGDLPDTEPDVDVDVTFTVEPSDNLSGRITGITLSDPIYSDTVYVLPRKLGNDHTPAHTHRPATDSEFDKFTGVQPIANPLMEFQPGTALPDNPGKVTSVTAIGNRGANSIPHTFLRGERDVTWYDENDGGLTTPILDKKVTIPFSMALVPQQQTRDIPKVGKIEQGYEDNGLAIPNIQTQAHTGPFPPAGRYQGRRNYYPSPDVPDYHRGVDMPQAYINDPPFQVGELQPIALGVTDTFPSTLDHESDRWLNTTLKSHTHDAMEVTMNRGSLALPTTVLVNNVSTGTTVPVSVDTALTIAVNPNTPSLTIMYIIRAF